MDRCCSRTGESDVFNERFARRLARRYRRRGLDEVARRLVDAVGVRAGETVLEIGGGIGDIEIELLRSGAEHATNVELSAAYEKLGRTLFEQAGFEGRIEWRYGDIATDPELAPPADVVVLNRVVCCYPDMPALVDAAAAKTRRSLALSFPRDTRLMRIGGRAINAWCRLRRSDFRFFVHPPPEIVAAAHKRGLHLVHQHRGRLWQVAALERS
ncbi:MAG: methyltransferase domain-containing protein [Gaiellaceae bacterium]